jgi:hypothetical protein
VTKPRFYVGILHSAEPQFDACLHSLNTQEDVSVNHCVFSGLSNSRAHTAVYRWFEENRTQTDFFCKLDADMELMHPHILRDIATFFLSHPLIDHSVFSLYDHYTQDSMFGLHVFRPTVHWEYRSETLFVDRPPRMRGRSVRIKTAPAPAGHHCKNPAPLQAYRFGLHRGLKLLQPGRRFFKVHNSYIQWKLFHTILISTKQGEPQQWALYALHELLTRRAPDLSNGYLSESVDTHFSEVFTQNPSTPQYCAASTMCKSQISWILFACTRLIMRYRV